MEYIDGCCIGYLDDVLLFSENLQSHQSDIRKILDTIQKSGIKVKPSKCEFPEKETEYLGFIISEDGVKADPVKTQAIWDWTSPKTTQEVQCFLEFYNFYRRFIEGFSRTAKPLT